MAATTDNDDRPADNIADSIYRQIKDGLMPQRINLVRNEVAAIPAGMRLESLRKHLDEYLEAPERRRGHTDHTDLASFIDWVRRLASPTTVVFARAHRVEPKLVAVFNHHPAGGDETAAGFADHRAVYHFPLSEEWQAWQATAGKLMGQAEFAEFVEDRLLDILPPQTELSGQAGEIAVKLPPDVVRFLAASRGRVATPEEMFALSRGLRVHAEDQVENRVDLQSGEQALVYKSEHRGADGGRVNVPSLFQIGIPVFDRGPAYVIAARLRYRLQQGTVKWAFQLHRADLVFDHAFAEAVATTRTEAGVPVYLGTAP